MPPSPCWMRNGALLLLGHSARRRRTALDAVEFFPVELIGHVVAGRPPHGMVTHRHSVMHHDVTTGAAGMVVTHRHSVMHRMMSHVMARGSRLDDVTTGAAGVVVRCRPCMARRGRCFRRGRRGGGRGSSGGGWCLRRGGGRWSARRRRRARGRAGLRPAWRGDREYGGDGEPIQEMLHQILCRSSGLTKISMGALLLSAGPAAGRPPQPN